MSSFFRKKQHPVKINFTSYTTCPSVSISTMQPMTAGQQCTALAKATNLQRYRTISMIKYDTE